MKSLFTLTLLALASCSDPSLQADLHVTPDGVEVRPALSGNLGGLGVTVAP